MKGIFVRDCNKIGVSLLDGDGDTSQLCICKQGASNAHKHSSSQLLQARTSHNNLVPMIEIGISSPSEHSPNFFKSRNGSTKINFYVGIR